MKKLFIISFAALLVMALTAPAMAKFDIGAYIQTQFYYFDRSAENKSGGTMHGAVSTDGDHSYTELTTPNFSRFNIQWTNEKNVRARFEVGGAGQPGANAAKQGIWAGGGYIQTRHAYGAWQVTPDFELLAGWTTLPFSPMTCGTQLLGWEGESHGILIGFGEYYAGRWPQLRGTWKFTDNMRLAVAISDATVWGDWAGFPYGAPNPIGGSPFAVAPAGATSDNETKLPRFDVGMPIYFGPLKLYPSLFYQKQTFDNVAINQDNDVTSWGLSLGWNLGFGPLTVSGEVNFGENFGYGSLGLYQALNGYYPYLMANGQISDTDELGIWIDIGLKLGPVTPHIAIGISDAENDGMAGSLDDLSRRNTAYVFAMDIPVAKTFLITPEIAFYDYDDDQLRGNAASIMGHAMGAAQAIDATGMNTPFDNGDQFIIGLRFTVIF